MSSDGSKEKIRALRAQNDRSNEKIAHLEYAMRQLRTELASSQQRSDSLNKLLCVYRQRHRCETLYAEGNLIDAAQSLLQIIEIEDEDVRTDTLITEWLSNEFYRCKLELSVQILLAGFPSKCVVALERAGDETLKLDQRNETLVSYSTALSLGPPTPDALLNKWASTMLHCGSGNEALDVAAKFKLPRFVIYRAICDTLEGTNRVMEAIECFRRMESGLTVDSTAHHKRAQWEPGFQQRCSQKLEMLAEAAMHSQNYRKAVEYFSTILQFNPSDRVDILIKRSKAQARMNSWEDALTDVDEIVKLNKSSDRNYEHNDAAKCYAEAVEAFETLLLKLKQAPASGQCTFEYHPSGSDAPLTLPSCATCHEKPPLGQPDLSDKAVQALTITEFEPVSPMAGEVEKDYEDVESWWLS